jgi:hypothetical protein
MDEKQSDFYLNCQDLHIFLFEVESDCALKKHWLLIEFTLYQHYFKGERYSLWSEPNKFLSIKLRWFY